MMDKYELSYKEYKECLNVAILGIFSMGRPSENPTSFFIVGQPGAGKSGLSSYTERSFNEKEGEGVIKIDPDLVAMYHQNYERIIEEIPEQSYAELQKFVNPALRDIRPMAVERKVNVLSEGTFSDTEEYIKILQEQVDAGYNVEINIIAVHRLESLLSAMERQQEKIEYNLPPRTVTIEHHDRAYNQVFATLRKIKEKSLAKKISVYRRGENEMTPQLVYTTDDTMYHDAEEALVTERRKNLEDILANQEDFKNRIRVLREKIIKNPRGEVQTLQLEQLQLIESELDQELSKEQEER